MGRGGAVVAWGSHHDRVRSYATRQLRRLGYEVVAADDGPAAVEVLRTGLPVDVLFTDVVMPGGMTGVELATLARELRPGLPVLLTSGYAGDALSDAEELPAGGELLAKPYRTAELADRLGVLFDGQGAGGR